ncbi:MAG: alpha/beta fold hydrolase [Acidimicrobiales bacterium]
MSELVVNTVGTTGRGDRLLVLIHGYGADEYDLAPLAPHIDPEGHFFTICPRGPHSVMGFGAGWYERTDDGIIDPATFLAAVDAIDATIDNACSELGFNRSQAVIIGFSQGGAMTLASALRAGGATRPVAIACLSGMLQQVDGLSYAFDDPGLPDILVHHGTLDPLVTVDRGRATRDTLTDNGVDHVYREYPMQHEISPPSVYDLRDWLGGYGSSSGNAH